RDQTASLGKEARDLRLLPEGAPVARLERDVAQRLADLSRKDEIVPGERRLEPLRERAEVAATAREELPCGFVGRLRNWRGDGGDVGRLRNVPPRERVERGRVPRAR